MHYFSDACERNKKNILQELKNNISNRASIFEIGSGTGQHALYFCNEMPFWIWQTSDLKENHSNINERISESLNSNILLPIEFDVNKDYQVLSNKYDLIFTANTFHIMSWNAVCNCIKKASELLKDAGKFIIYGPFLFPDKITKKSNILFDDFLKNQNKEMGLRHFYEITRKLKQVDLIFEKNIEMPSNNNLLIYIKNKSTNLL